MSFLGSGSQGSIRYQLIVDDAGANAKIGTFKNSLTQLAPATQQVNTGMNTMANNFKGTSTSMQQINGQLTTFSNNIKGTGTTVSQTNNQISILSGTFKSTSGSASQMGNNISILSKNFNTSTGAAKDMVAQTKNVGTQTKSLASNAKDLGSKFSTMAIGISATATSALQLAAGFRDYNDAQIQVDRVTRKISVSNESLQKAQDKLNTLTAKGVTSGKEYEQAQLDVAQAHQQVEIQTQLLGEAQERMFDSQTQFAVSIVPTVLGAVGTIGAAFKDLQGVGTKLKDMFGALGSSIKGLSAAQITFGALGTAAGALAVGIGTILIPQWFELNDIIKEMAKPGADMDKLGARIKDLQTKFANTDPISKFLIELSNIGETAKNAGAAIDRADIAKKLTKMLQSPVFKILPADIKSKIQEQVKFIQDAVTNESNWTRYKKDVVGRLVIDDKASKAFSTESMKRIQVALDLIRQLFHDGAAKFPEELIKGLQEGTGVVGPKMEAELDKIVTMMGGKLHEKLQKTNAELVKDAQDFFEKTQRDMLAAKNSAAFGALITGENILDEFIWGKNPDAEKNKAANQFGGSLNEVFQNAKAEAIRLTKGSPPPEKTIAQIIEEEQMGGLGENIQEQAKQIENAFKNLHLPMSQTSKDIMDWYTQMGKTVTGSGPTMETMDEILKDLPDDEKLWGAQIIKNNADLEKRAAALKKAQDATAAWQKTVDEFAKTKLDVASIFGFDKKFGDDKIFKDMVNRLPKKLEKELKGTIKANFKIEETEAQVKKFIETIITPLKNMPGKYVFNPDLHMDKKKAVEYGKDILKQVKDIPDQDTKDAAKKLADAIGKGDWGGITQGIVGVLKSLDPDKVPPIPVKIVAIDLDASKFGGSSGGKVTSNSDPGSLWQFVREPKVSIPAKIIGVAFDIPKSPSGIRENPGHPGQCVDSAGNPVPCPKDETPKATTQSINLSNTAALKVIDVVAKRIQSLSSIQAILHLINNTAIKAVDTIANRMISLEKVIPTFHTDNKTAIKSVDAVAKRVIGLEKVVPTLHVDNKTAIKAVDVVAKRINSLENLSPTVHVKFSGSGSISGSASGSIKIAQHGMHEMLNKDTVILAHKGERVDIGRPEHSATSGGGVNGPIVINLTIDGNEIINTRSLKKVIRLEGGQLMDRF